MHLKLTMALVAVLFWSTSHCSEPQQHTGGMIQYADPDPGPHPRPHRRPRPGPRYTVDKDRLHDCVMCQATAGEDCGQLRGCSTLCAGSTDVNKLVAVGVLYNVQEKCGAVYASASLVLMAAAVVISVWVLQ